MHILTPSGSKRHEQTTILIVEDDEDNLLYLTSALGLFNYHYFAAKDAISGLSLAQTKQPDLILLDIKMPQISGIELVKTLKMDWLTRSIPVVAITALAREQEKNSILAAGFDGYLVKPFLLEDLEQAICSHLVCKHLP
ncbi:MAG: response regulator [Cyanobacteria bacterium P01_G01_bin.39]